VSDSEERAELRRYVARLLGEEKALKWWLAPNPMLGNIAPFDLECLSDRHAEKLYGFIRSAREANECSPVPQKAEP
jgi:hypothetical protein